MHLKLQVKIDCKHPDTDHETTEYENKVYAEFYGTESDDRIIGEYWDNPSRSFVDRAEWVVKGTSNCDGSLKNWVSPKQCGVCFKHHHIVEFLIPMLLLSIKRVQKQIGLKGIVMVGLFPRM